MRKIKLADAILNENFELDGDNKYSTVDKQHFLERCKKYSKYKESVYRSSNLKEQLAEIKDLIETAEKLTIQETENWFDSVTVQRHLKQMKESYKVLEKTGKELMGLQQRFEASYEDIGEILNKYYEVS